MKIPKSDLIAIKQKQQDLRNADKDTRWWNGRWQRLDKILCLNGAFSRYYGSGGEGLPWRYKGGTSNYRNTALQHTQEELFEEVKRLRGNYIRNKTHSNRYEYIEKAAAVLCGRKYKHGKESEEFKSLKQKMILRQSPINIAWSVVKERGYEKCTNPDHGFGRTSTYSGKTGTNVITICPIVQFTPQPSYSFHSEEDLIKWSM